MSRYIVKWTKGRKSAEVGPINNFDLARSIANEKASESRVVTILKEGAGVNAGQFYLHQIVK